MKLHLEEGFTQRLVAQEMGVTLVGLQKWVSQYRQYGEEGLKDRDRKPSDLPRYKCACCPSAIQ